MKKKIKKTVSITIIVFLVIWTIIGTVDFLRIKSFERPLFTLAGDTFDDGGSGPYYGLGYSIEIKGIFLGGEELRGITHYKYRLFGVLVSEGIRE